MRLLGPKPLSAAQQLLSLKAGNRGEGTGILKRDKLTWDFDACPTPLSRTYNARICYRAGQPPVVFVRKPHLPTLAGGRRLPHVYQQDPTRLCLYLPDSGEWSPTMRISETFVPWTVLWLFYFEEWLATNEWKGGGVHPGGRNDKD